MHVSYSAAQNAGNLKVVVVGCKDAQGLLVSVADSSNNSYTLAVGPTTRGLAVSQILFLRGKHRWSRRQREHRHGDILSAR